LKFDIVEHCLCFGDEIVDYLTAATAASDDDLIGCLNRLLRFGDCKWNLAFFLLRTSLRQGGVPSIDPAASAGGVRSASIRVGSFS
jgi:hypothetical protein